MTQKEKMQLVKGALRTVIGSLSEEEALDIYFALFNHADTVEIVSPDYSQVTFLDLIGGEVVDASADDGLFITVRKENGDVVSIYSDVDGNYSDRSCYAYRADVIDRGHMTGAQVDIVADELLRIARARAHEQRAGSNSRGGQT